MTDKELRQLGRRELLEMLIEQGKELQSLRDRLAEAERALQDREIKIRKAGSIAEAALQLNGVFEAAEMACRQYIENVQALAAAPEKETVRTDNPMPEKAAAHAASPAPEKAAAHAASPAPEKAAAHAAGPAPEKTAVHTEPSAPEKTARTEVRGPEVSAPVMPAARQGGGNDPFEKELLEIKALLADRG